MLFPVLLFSGCAGFANRLSEDATPDPGMAYMFGELRIGGADLTMGVEFENLDTRDTYTIPFVSQKALVMISVPPGNYRAVNYVFAGNLGGLIKKVPVKNGFMAEPFKVEENIAYYLADVAILAVRDRTATYSEARWEIASVEHDLKTAVSRFRNEFPGFSAMRVVAAWRSTFDGGADYMGLLE